MKTFTFTKAEQKKNAEPIIKLLDAIAELEKELAKKTRRPTLKELAEQFHADAERGAPLSRLQDDQRRMYQEALGLLARHPYECTKDDTHEKRTRSGRKQTAPHKGV
jgi:DNA-binding GntR family transcriptional regulator